MTCGKIHWSKEAMDKHQRSVHRTSQENYVSFLEPELCPFLFPNERKVCNCVQPQAIYPDNTAACPYLLDRPDIKNHYHFIEMKPGIYIGRIESINITNNRVHFILAGNGARYLFDSPKTIAFEIFKRSVSKELSEFSISRTGVQRVWEGFQFIMDHQEQMTNMFDQVIRSGFVFSFEVKEGGIIGQVRRIDGKESFETSNEVPPYPFVQ